MEFSIVNSTARGVSSPHKKQVGLRRFAKIVARRRKRQVEAGGNGRTFFCLPGGPCGVWRGLDGRRCESGDQRRASSGWDRFPPGEHAEFKPTSSGSTTFSCCPSSSASPSWCSRCWRMWCFDSTRMRIRLPHGSRITRPWRSPGRSSPALVLVVIAVPSFHLLAEQLIIPAPDLTLKVTASQWHWNYGYPKSEGGFSFDSLIKEDKDLKPGDSRLSDRRQRAYVPVGKVVEVDVTSQDVIHSFSVPSFGVKIDAIPGRLNKAWFKAEHEGVFHGQCSNICGIDHAFMPIEIHVVSQTRTRLARDGEEAVRPRGRRRSRRGVANHPVTRALAAFAQEQSGAEKSWRQSANSPIRRPRLTRSTAIRPGGGDTCFRPTTRTSARSTSSSRSARASSACSFRSPSAPS